MDTDKTKELSQEILKLRRQVENQARQIKQLTDMVYRLRRSYHEVEIEVRRNQVGHR